MKFKSSLWVVLLVLGASATMARAEAVTATVLHVHGNVYVTTSSGKSEKLKDGEHIAVGSLIHTNSDSTVSLKLVPGASTVVTPGTDVTITALAYSSDKGVKTRTVKLKLAQGALICSLAKHDGHSKFLVSTPMGVTKAVGTNWKVSFSPSAGVTVQTVDGVVTITLPGGKIVTVPGGQETTSPDGTTTVVGKLSEDDIKAITTALNDGQNGGGSFTIGPADSTSSNPANNSLNTAISPTY